MIIQIFDKLCFINNSQFDTPDENEELTLEDLKGKSDQLLKLLAFLEIFAYNNLNLVIIKQIHGIDAMIELLKCYGNKIGNDELLIDIETKLLCCLSICMRNDRIGEQFLDDEDEIHALNYVTDIVEE